MKGDRRKKGKEENKRIYTEGGEERTTITFSVEYSQRGQGNSYGPKKKRLLPLHGLNEREGGSCTAREGKGRKKRGNHSYCRAFPKKTRVSLLEGGGGGVAGQKERREKGDLNRLRSSKIDVFQRGGRSRAVSSDEEKKNEVK